MELRSSKVHRRLDAKLKIGGVEATDLLAVLILAAVLNLFLGSFAVGPIFILCLPGVLFLILYFGKRGKPEGFLKDALRYYLSPGALMAGSRKDDN